MFLLCVEFGYPCALSVTGVRHEPAPKLLQVFDFVHLARRPTHVEDEGLDVVFEPGLHEGLPVMVVFARREVAVV